MMPGKRGSDAPDVMAPLGWSAKALGLLEQVDDHLVTNIRLRAEKSARRDLAGEVGPEHVAPFLDNAELAEEESIPWSAAALARIARSPEMLRERIKSDIEEAAEERGHEEVSLELAEEVIAELRKAMCPVPEGEEG